MGGERGFRNSGEKLFLNASLLPLFPPFSSQYGAPGIQILTRGRGTGEGWMKQRHSSFCNPKGHATELSNTPPKALCSLFFHLCQKCWKDSNVEPESPRSSRGWGALLGLPHTCDEVIGFPRECLQSWEKQVCSPRTYLCYTRENDLLLGPRGPATQKGVDCG